MTLCSHKSDGIVKVCLFVGKIQVCVIGHSHFTSPLPFMYLSLKEICFLEEKPSPFWYVIFTFLISDCHDYDQFVTLELDAYKSWMFNMIFHLFFQFTKL
jgi:hypothetical protein